MTHAPYHRLVAAQIRFLEARGWTVEVTFDGTFCREPEGRDVREDGKPRVLHLGHAVNSERKRNFRDDEAEGLLRDEEVVYLRANGYERFPGMQGPSVDAWRKGKRTFFWTEKAVNSQRAHDEWALKRERSR